MTFYVGVSRDRENIVVDECEGRRIYLSRGEWDSFKSREKGHWAALQLQILNVAEQLGWWPPLRAKIGDGHEQV